MEKLKIIVCTHKADDRIRNYAPYVPVHGGKALHPDMDLGFIGDDTGDNISEKNPLYSEWSVIYWAWKNCNDSEYIGFNHYRRYFKINITEDNIDNIMGKADVIALKRTNKSRCFRIDDLSRMTSQEDAYLFIDSVLSIHPDSKEALLRYFYNSTEYFFYSMFIMRRELFDEYCNFIFPVLFDLEKRIKPHGYSRQQRALGYFGETSLGLFIYYKNIKVKGVEITGTDELTDSKAKIMFRNFRNLLNRVLEAPIPIPKEFVVPEFIKIGLKNDNIELRKIK